MEIKDTKSKLSAVQYNKLQPQEYLKMTNISLDQVLAILLFRTRMVPCDGNFKSSRTIKECPWCEDHPDTQDRFFDCEHIGKIININGTYNEIFGDQVSPALARTLRNIWMYRLERRKDVTVSMERPRCTV